MNEDDKGRGERHIVPTQTATVGDREKFMAEVIGQKRSHGESALHGWRQELDQAGGVGGHVGEKTAGTSRVVVVYCERTVQQ